MFASRSPQVILAKRVIALLTLVFFLTAEAAWAAPPAPKNHLRTTSFYLKTPNAQAGRSELRRIMKMLELDPRSSSPESRSEARGLQASAQKRHTKFREISFVKLAQMLKRKKEDYAIYSILIPIAETPFPPPALKPSAAKCVPPSPLPWPRSFFVVRSCKLGYISV